MEARPLDKVCVGRHPEDHRRQARVASAGWLSASNAQGPVAGDLRRSHMEVVKYQVIVLINKSTMQGGREDLDREGDLQRVLKIQLVEKLRRQQ